MHFAKASHSFQLFLLSKGTTLYLLGCGINPNNLQPRTYSRHWLIIIIDESIPKKNKHCILFISVIEENVDDVIEYVQQVL